MWLKTGIAVILTGLMTWASIQPVDSIFVAVLVFVAACVVVIPTVYILRNDYSYDGIRKDCLDDEIEERYEHLNDSTGVDYTIADDFSRDVIDDLIPEAERLAEIAYNKEYGIKPASRELDAEEKVLYEHMTSGKALPKKSDFESHEGDLYEVVDGFGNVVASYQTTPTLVHTSKGEPVRTYEAVLIPPKTKVIPYPPYKWV